MGQNNYKLQAEEFIIKVDEFSNKRIKNAEDLARLSELFFKEDKFDMLNDLAFSAKYAQGLIKIIRDRSNNFEDDYFEKIRSEYTAAIKKIRKILDEIIGSSSSFLKGIFSDKYLSMTHESLNNLNQLIDDLSWVKLYLNDQKR
ncbi:hypothetical protein ASZ90_004925 [hydrocarbon metagenome]|uniref:Uncharacterized protein n=1 Tax=hydrocarbon metagenome TaxID=938273 RepID=A0A0W8FWN2_9ZZZZ